MYTFTQSDGMVCALKNLYNECQQNFVVCLSAVCSDMKYMYNLSPNFWMKGLRLLGDQISKKMPTSFCWGHLNLYDLEIKKFGYKINLVKFVAHHWPSMLESAMMNTIWSIQYGHLVCKVDLTIFVLCSTCNAVQWLYATYCHYQLHQHSSWNESRRLLLILYIITLFMQIKFIQDVNIE